MTEHTYTYTTEDLLTNLTTIANDIETPPTTSQYNNHPDSLATAQTYMDRFGSWGDALDAAGLDTDPSLRSNPVPGKISLLDLLSDLESVADDLGHAPNLEQYREHGTHSASTVLNRFDSWVDALDSAGLDPDTRPMKNRIPTADLIEDLRTGAAILGHSPTTVEIKAYGSYSVITYRKRFGSWGDALSAADLPESGTDVSFSPDDLFDSADEAPVASA